LKSSLIQKGAFPGGERGSSSVKYKVISLLPYVPGSNDEDLHKEGILILLFRLHHHLEEITLKVPVHIQVLPAGLTEWTAEEEVESSFLNILIAENAVIVIALQLVLFPFKKVPCV